MPSLPNSLIPLTSRHVTAADRDILFLIYASTRTEELQLVDWNEQQKTDFLQMQYRSREAHYQTHYSDASDELILLEKEPVGRLFVYRTSLGIHIIDISILPKHRGHGIGSQLLQEILDESDRKNIPVSIHVEQFNPAQRLYLRLGFRFVEQNGIYWLMHKLPGEITRPTDPILPSHGECALC